MSVVARAAAVVAEAALHGVAVAAAVAAVAPVLVVLVIALALVLPAVDSVAESRIDGGQWAIGELIPSCVRRRCIL